MTGVAHARYNTQVDRQPEPLVPCTAVVMNSAAYTTVSHASFGAYWWWRVQTPGEGDAR